jgi:hypothetical protein
MVPSDEAKMTSLSSLVIPPVRSRLSVMVVMGVRPQLWNLIFRTSARHRMSTVAKLFGRTAKVSALVVLELKFETFSGNVNVCVAANKCGAAAIFSLRYPCLETVL